MRRTVLVALLALAALVGAAGTALATHLFRDVGHADTHAPGITWAAERGLVAGHADGTFRAADPVSRGQLATVLQRQGAWRGPVYSLTPLCGTLDLQVVDHNGRGSGEATVEWSVDGGPRTALTAPVPADGSPLRFTVDRPGVVSVFVDSLAWVHAPTAQSC